MQFKSLVVFTSFFASILAAAPSADTNLQGQSAGETLSNFQTQGLCWAGDACTDRNCCDFSRGPIPGTGYCEC
ncbi:hypothetical protein P168DRAFT_289648 [Aspergillus campestris IBT 28561]|uniref:Uncharacterized protein n=1 Tax=Aspergillus campestris (strain IBT 28561) TaxID=1392248 RepID=A0A2I1D4J2_ASPC2|nr:uncharacterized protein P168DRAFT_289648 [Aspergillus campestris IBT 28561]PKY04786.1 hypothetical protein P168DRAFT_289648 [Aspergillus campestris IBT 28561]